MRGRGAVRMARRRGPKVTKGGDDMLLELTREGDYAVRAMLALALHDGDAPLSRRQIASEWQIPARFLGHVLRRLAERDLVEPVVGRAGGYRLHRPAGAITLLDIVGAVEELPSGRRCVLRGGPCRPDGTCLVHDAFTTARERYIETLAGHTLATLVTARDPIVPRGSTGRHA